MYTDEIFSSADTATIRKAAAYIWLYARKPLDSFCTEKNGTEILYSGINRNRGKVLKYAKDGLYFRHDTYCDGHMAVTYNYVRKEDRETFEKILDNVYLTCRKDENNNSHIISNCSVLRHESAESTSKCNTG